MAVCVALGLPAAIIRLAGFAGSDIHLAPGLMVLVFGGGIVGAAFLISWAAEAAQKDISATLALAFLALIAVLPEYSVDFYLAWQAGQDPAGPYVHYATANMTGANRLLVGLGWPMIAIIFWVKSRRSLQLERAISLELLFLGIATVYALTIPFKHGIAVWDGAVLIGLFAVYMWMAGKAPHQEPELEGPAATLGNMSKTARRAVVAGLFVYCAAVIFASAEPFAEGLLKLGKQAGIDEFLLIQWVAPLASEAPEMLVAILFALRGHASAAMTALISSKVNQWTLLIGSLPVVFAVSSGHVSWTGMPLDGRQAEEIWLTAGQSLFAVALLSGRSIGVVAALGLLILWATQLGFTGATWRWGYVGTYIGFAVLIWALSKRHRTGAVRLVPDATEVFRKPKATPAAPARRE
jgi:cation:H+ antiporter